MLSNSKGRKGYRLNERGESNPYQAEAERLIVHRR